MCNAWYTVKNGPKARRDLSTLQQSNRTELASVIAARKEQRDFMVYTKDELKLLEKQETVVKKLSQ